MRNPLSHFCLPSTIVCLATLALSASGQQPITPATPDPAVAAALGQVSSNHIYSDIARLVLFNNRSTVSSLDTDLPPGTGVLAAADWITAEFTRISVACGNCLEVKRDDFIEPPQVATAGGPVPRIVKPTRIVNVYAVLQGSDPAQAARRVLVTGHYDSRNTDVMNTHEPAPGANDDASGVAVSLECARVLTQSGIKFPATLVFVAVAGEEQGLNGSAHLAHLAKSEGWELEAVLNNDIVGGDTTPGDEAFEDKSAVRVFSEGVPGTATLDDLHAIQNIGAENDSASRELARAVQDVASTYFQPGPIIHPDPISLAFHQVLIFRRDRFLRGGDHTSFNREGFAAVRFTEWRENFNHQHQDVRVAPAAPMSALNDPAFTGPAPPVPTQFGDLIQFVDPAYVANVARLNAATLATLALAPGEPRNVHVLTSNLDNNTQLTWDPPAGQPAGASFEVVWRASDAPAWTHSQAVPHGVRLVDLAVSKDNNIFGVRSVDPAGHRSPAVYPVPTRASSLPQPAAKPDR